MELHHAILATDVLLFTFRASQLWVRTITVDRPPYFVNMKGFPGGLIKPDENAEAAAIRCLREKAGILSKLFIEQLYAFSEIDRDPRGRVVSVAYLACVPWDDLSELEQVDQDATAWRRVNGLGKLAYDHNEMLNFALEWLKAKAKSTNLLSWLMPKEFTLTELQSCYEQILEVKLDKRNFRKKILQLDLLKLLAKKTAGMKNRPAQLYQFNSKKVTFSGNLI